MKQGAQSGAQGPGHLEGAARIPASEPGELRQASGGEAPVVVVEAKAAPAGEGGGLG